MNIQDYQNAYHNHSFTPAGSISIKTNPTFTGTAVTSGANSRGHTHKRGTMEIEGITSRLSESPYAESGAFSNIETSGWSGAFGGSGSFRYTKVQLKASNNWTGSTSDESQTHTHSVTANGTISGGAYTFTGTAGNTGYNGNSSIKEARPSNYSYVIWKRIA